MMQEHFRRFGQFGLVLAMCLLPMITADRGQELNLDEMSDKFSDYKNGSTEMPELEENPFVSTDSKSRFNKRMRGVVIDMARLGYI